MARAIELTKNQLMWLELINNRIDSDFSEDLKIGPDIIKSNVDIYRRLRNTIRFILGNLSDFSNDSSMEYNDLTDLDKYVLSQLFILEKNVFKISRRNMVPKKINFFLNLKIINIKMGVMNI